MVRRGGLRRPSKGLFESWRPGQTTVAPQPTRLGRRKRTRHQAGTSPAAYRGNAPDGERRRPTRPWWWRRGGGSRGSGENFLDDGWVPDGDPEWELVRDVSDALKAGDRLALVVGLVVAVMIVTAVLAVTLA